MTGAQVRPPKRPPGRIIDPLAGGSCPVCGSTEVWSWGFISYMFGRDPEGCINPECDRYYKQKKPKMVRDDVYLPPDFR
jgi:hypothetical protein